ncbi:MAG: N-acetylmuramoyl-L-alanine amidase [Lachnospiraceae bacterium]|nr:N-acetylmuramoyl-L-alanine amidase [Lachnospiraceae bacterium]
MKEQDWINLIAEDAQRAANEYRYLPSVLIAQTCQETGYGETDLSREGIYNVVGMKAELLNDTWTSEHWHGEIYTKKTPEWYNGKKTYIYDNFRVYDSYYDGLADFCQFLRDAKYSKNGSYKYRGLLGTNDPYTLIEGVRSRGYCTDPEYSNAIMRIIGKHELTKYDATEGESMGDGAMVIRVEKPDIIDRIEVNEGEVPEHNANSHEYLAIHYLGVDGENPDLYGGGYGGHFYVSKDGRCYQAAKVTDKLWHVGASSGFTYKHPYARNANTIGIECACYSRSGRWFFTETTQQACVKLAAWIMSEYGIPTSNLLRHGDITTKHCPSPYIDNPGETPNWTWERFRNAVDALLGGGGTVDSIEALQGVKRLVGLGQKHSVNFTGHQISVDGVRGKETTANMVRCLQRAANLDWGAGLEEDGLIGPKTRAAFVGHFIKVGEVQYMVTAVEIVCYCLGRNPNGVELPGVFGDGLAKAVDARYLSGEDILALVS